MTDAVAHIPPLETARLTMRAPGAADLPAVLGFFGSERSSFYSGPMSEGDAWRKFAAYVGQWPLRGYGMYAVTLKETGETVGLAGPVHPADFPEPEMSWLLTDARHEGKGLAFEASRAVLDTLFALHGWDSVVSYIHPANAASRALALRLAALPDPGTPAPIPGCDTFRHPAPPAIPVLETERLTLRGPRSSDLSAYAEFNRVSDVTVGKYRGGKSAADVAAVLETDIAHWREHGYGTWLLVAKSGAGVIGGAGLVHPDGWSGHELTWWLMPDARGRGYATEASRAVLGWAHDHLGWSRVETMMRDENLPARRIAERLGGMVIRREIFPDGIARDVFVMKASPT